ncbi:MAG TPA: Gfo/Idh/MocA family oxidoreductase [Candidatus Brocadiia bacterium]|nr:Gfo/Idh/MocA family oxidoreductase [Candidatus Brocadiia bacterium]
MSQPVSAVVVGAGHRALVYAAYAKHNPGEFRIVGVADPIERRRRQVAELYGIPPERCFATSEELASVPKFADAAINATMDDQHVPTSLPLLEAGYDILLEKPFATNEDEIWRLLKASRENGRKVMICHVLRYAPFYYAIRKKVADGEIGEIVNVQTIEHVSYHHMSVAFVRGKWNRKDVCHSSMLMAKCCHDLDLVVWMKSGVAPRAVASFGCNMQFRPEKAPDGAGTRCLVDCRIEKECPYSAMKIYIDHPERWSFYVWSGLEHIPNPTLEQKVESLRTDNPHGRCMWRCDNEVVDHQSVAIEFEDGSTATHNMVGGSARPSRSIHLIGSKGEIQGVFEDNRFVIRHIDARPGREYSEQVVDLTKGGDMHGAFGGHGGGDLRLVGDFVRFVRGAEPSIACTSVEDSVNGHLIGFSADRAMEEKRLVELKIRSLWR